MLLLCVFTPAAVQAFSFSDYEQRQQREEQDVVEARRQRLADLRSAPCSARLKNQTIAFVLYEDHNGTFFLRSGRENGAVASVINSKLSQLGLKTLTQKEIEGRIADAEAQAFLANDMDAAASAAQRLRARFMLKGQVITQRQLNPVVGIDEVSVTLVLTLLDDTGRTLSHVRVAETAFSDSRVEEALLKLVEVQGEQAIIELYHAFCRQEG
ncbi:MAG: hypothetical protein JXR59_00940 [Desulfuromonadaceae bacterium]|nr:hypothetical protein [Desulfuromonadaceae bacterium]